MAFWNELARLLLLLTDQLDERAVALLVLVEEAGVPIPIPSDLLMLMSGYRVAHGELSLASCLLLFEAATILGASILYWVGARGGRPLLHRYGRYLHLDPARLDRVEARLRRRGVAAIVVGRLVPGLRVATPLAAGALGVPYRLFLPGLALGGGLYVAAFVLAGMLVGPSAIEALEGARISIRAVATVLLCAGLTAALAGLSRRGGARAPTVGVGPAGAGGLETAALAGLLATLAMGLGVNALLYLVGALGMVLPERVMLEVVERAATRYAGGTAPEQLALLTAVLFAGAVLWAALYAQLGRAWPAGPPWLRGLAFAALPLTFSGLVVLPLLGAGPFGFGMGAGPLPLVGELLRHALFGVALGICDELLRTARALPRRELAAPPAYAA